MWGNCGIVIDFYMFWNIIGLLFAFRKDLEIWHSSPVPNAENRMSLILLSHVRIAVLI